MRAASAHPAPYSETILNRFRIILTGSDLPVHDPYAGEGARLGALCTELGIEFSGTEIEEAFIVDPRVAPGNATDPASYPSVPYRLVTSPVYPNGVADHFTPTGRCSVCKGTGLTAPSLHAQGPCPSCDGEGRRQIDRNTYRQALAKIVGHDDPLDEDNMGRWGYRSTGPTSTKRLMYWSLARRTVTCWGNAALVVVNVSDFVHTNGRVEPVVNDWCNLLRAYGWNIRRLHKVETPRNRKGANGSARVDAEHIIVAVPGDA